MKEAVKLNRGFFRSGYGFLIIWAFGLNFIIECLARKDFIVLGTLKYMVDSPLVFLYNTLLIFATLSISMLFMKRTFVLVAVTAVWMTIGVTNGIILTQRMTPFTVKDLTAMTDAATIATNYFSIWQIVGIFAGVACVVLGFVFLYFKTKKHERKTGDIKKNLVTVVLIIACTFGTTAGLLKVNVLSSFFGNLSYAYQDYGLPYCFVNTWLNTGIHKPAGYSESKIQTILKDTVGDKAGKVTVDDTKNSVTINTDSGNTTSTGTISKTATDSEPNIIFLQLESFVDPELFNNIKLSEDPIPTYRKLMKEYSSGSLQVPACGAGTANTEFEVITGLSVKFFGPGEYPFKSVLKKKTCESTAYDLDSIGYTSHLIHNHRAMFYNRNIAYANMGFNTFTSLEYMSDVPKNPKGWAKDEVLTGQIMDALNSTKNQDYIYTVSVQGHGKYPTEQLITNPEITVLSAPSEEMKWMYEYYVNQIHEMDQFVKDLTTTLSKYDEPTVLVMYGDHIPALDVTEDAYDGKNLYTTQYVIWSNYGAFKKEDKDMYAYQLSADVLDRLGINVGTVLQYQQNSNHKAKNYLKNLKELGYDMLYGKDYIYGGKDPFTASNLKMGVKTIKIDKIVSVGGKYYIKGQNFTEYSKITLNGETLKTIYLGPNLLGLLEEVDPSDASNMKVSQIDKSNKEIISSTE